MQLHLKHSMPKKPEEEKSETTSDVSLIDEGSASIVFSPKQHLLGILSYCDIYDLSKSSKVNSIWKIKASSFYELWSKAIQQCYTGVNQPPRWFRNSSEPQQLISHITSSAISNGIEEEKKQTIQLSIPSTTALQIESWKEDVIVEAEEVGVRNYCRWDLIDAVKDETALRYSFQFYGNDIYFTAVNTAASRLGVGSCYFKTWIRGNNNDGGDSNIDDKENVVDEGKKNDRATKQDMVTIANLEQEGYQQYQLWQKRNRNGEKGKRRKIMPSNTFNGNVRFEVLPAVGPLGKATVDYHRI